MSDFGNPCTGVTFLMGIGNFRYRVVWSLREKKQPGKAKKAKAVSA